MEIKTLCEKFKLNGEFVKAKMIPNGIINNTYKVQFDNNGKKTDYIIQKINKFVFKHPDEIMKNIFAISNHLFNKMVENRISTKRNVLQYVVSKDEMAYYIDEDGEYWRCYKFIDKSVTYDNPDDLKIIEQAGMAFGQFQALLTDFDASSLYESIPDFHETKKRYEAFKNSIDLDLVSRVESVRDEIKYLLDRENTAVSLVEMLNNHQLPLKVTHNDTKCNNVLFDKKTNEALAVIDLDTVMPGIVAYDFGDAIRSIASTTDEDETNLSKVDIDLNKVEAFTKGYLSRTASMLTENEISSLSTGILVITLELASRFLKDYLEGDVYFKINYPTHNLDRARCQIALAKKIEENFSNIQAIIKKYSN